MTDTNGIEYTTMHDQKPTHKVESDLLAALHQDKDNAWAAFQANAEQIETEPDPDKRVLLFAKSAELLEAAVNAEDIYTQAWREENICTCNGANDTCPVCRQRSEIQRREYLAQFYSSEVEA